jgi:hypothetical protein
MDDETVRRFAELRDQAATDDAQALAHRIASGEEPMYPVPEPADRVFDARSGSSAVPLTVLVIVLLGTIVYALVR